MPQAIHIDGQSGLLTAGDLANIEALIGFELDPAQRRALQSEAPAFAAAFRGRPLAEAMVRRLRELHEPPKRRARLGFD
jgi:hypothetical protein